MWLRNFLCALLKRSVCPDSRLHALQIVILSVQVLGRRAAWGGSIGMEMLHGQRVLTVLDSSGSVQAPLCLKVRAVEGLHMPRGTCQVVRDLFLEEQLTGFAPPPLLPT